MALGYRLCLLGWAWSPFLNLTDLESCPALSPQRGSTVQWLATALTLLQHFQAGGPRVSHITSLCLSFLIRKMGTIKLSPS